MKNKKVIAIWKSKFQALNKPLVAVILDILKIQPILKFKSHLKKVKNESAVVQVV